jgi:hypothetical protein
MTKVQEAIEVLQNMPAEKASMFADAIIDAATPRAEDMHLSDEQVAEIERRLADQNPKFITLAEAQARLKRVGV